MMPGWAAVGAGACAVAVAAGAFGAHGLRGRFDARALELWETAARYLMYGGLGTLLLAFGPHPGFRRAAALLAAGTLLFAGTVFALALGGPRWLGAVTPIGGLLMIAGFALAAWAALRPG